MELEKLVHKHEYLFTDSFLPDILSSSQFTEPLQRYDYAYEKLNHYGRFDSLGNFTPSKSTKILHKFSKLLSLPQIISDKINPPDAQQSKGVLRYLRENAADVAKTITALAYIVPVFVIQDYAHPWGDVYGMALVCTLRGVYYEKAFREYRTQCMSIKNLIQETNLNEKLLNPIDINVPTRG